jgi:ABC-type phosphate transport system substrate-binding protein
LEKLKENKSVVGCILAGFLFIVVFTSIAKATEIVVNKTVPAEGYSASDIRAIFTMKKRFWSNQRQIKVYTLSDSNPLHKDFVKNNLNMFPHQIRLIWDRITFSGTGSAPIELDSEQEMINKIANTPDAIGYLNSKSDNENIRSIEYH